MDISYINDLHIDNWVMNNKSYEKHKKSVKEFIKRLIENSYIYDKDVIIEWIKQKLRNILCNYKT
ncbi:hypothetical protein GJU84_04485 [Staphylococcus chromogenes]|uniref:hypothetical protein n=1 Tax=Staphylococcus chromogenes TaxID=46126 RepID=UPI0014051770|nr:hypothetical protein [Staphylococcus chromogenes]QIN26329.1 hypothetical protein GJU84_04485 [Staphylococcus chromogenes]